MNDRCRASEAEIKHDIATTLSDQEEIAQILARKERLESEVDNILGGNDVDFLIDCIVESETVKDCLVDMLLVNNTDFDTMSARDMMSLTNFACNTNKAIREAVREGLESREG